MMWGCNWSCCYKVCEKKGIKKWRGGAKYIIAWQIKDQFTISSFFFFFLKSWFLEDEMVLPCKKEALSHDGFKRTYKRKKEKNAGGNAKILEKFNSKS